MGLSKSPSTARMLGVATPRFTRLRRIAARRRAAAERATEATPPPPAPRPAPVARRPVQRTLFGDGD